MAGRLSCLLAPRECPCRPRVASPTRGLAHLRVSAAKAKGVEGGEGNRDA
eukprot:CAMPEP_0115874196 /NCGR_PEP_ID=MMETSP0287-20121206/24408_1 /TAXON_ID=412157 /ORGANISM="Chrysochromulina rotalis, Strain UIO044" /LENGTH=49 /DNA_ID= /DNA_START= /DNA_END= /DNA_ORIENTATION=